MKKNQLVHKPKAVKAQTTILTAEALAAIHGAGTRYANITLKRG